MSKEVKYHYLYKTTNLINNKFYIGLHSTYNLDDGYLGSGLMLRRSVIKYGVENFKIEFIKFFENREELINAEKEIVDDILINENLCMNLKPGGSGGFCNTQHRLKCSMAGNKKKNELRANDVDWKIRESKQKSETMLLLIDNGLERPPPSFSGLKHKEETKSKIGIANSIKQKGDRNSQFGTCWITKDGINKKIKKDELEIFIKFGWNKGRKC